MKAPNEIPSPGQAPAIANSGLEAYSAKTPAYFTGARRDYVSELPLNPNANILEIGCGEGGTGLLALSEGRCKSYCGVEICKEVAERAQPRISQIVIGNVEELELPWQPESFDALILSEVLEHLVDPWRVLRKLHPLLKPGALVFASSPNVAHYKTITMLVRGQWALDDMGRMDRTHLRWFTPKTYKELFESCGFTVNSLRELLPLRPKARLFLFFSLGHLRHLFMAQMDVRARRI